MKALFYIGHPSHVHLFKNSIKELESEGHSTRVIARKKDITLDLLNELEIDYIPTYERKGGVTGLPIDILQEYRYNWKVIRRYDPDVVVSRFNPPIVHLAKITGAKSLIFELNEKHPILAKSVTPVADRICTPVSFTQDRGKTHHRYNGFHEIAYLHPNRFEPMPAALEEYGVSPDETFYVVRIVEWNAYHDFGTKGVSNQEWKNVTEELSNYGKVFVSSEREIDLPGNVESIPVPVHLMHQLLYFADLYVGESGTMPIEAGLLGTPAVCINPLTNGWGIFDQLVDEYQIVCTADDTQDILDIVKQNQSNKTLWKDRRDRVFDSNIDVTNYMLEQILELGNS